LEVEVGGAGAAPWERLDRLEVEDDWISNRILPRLDPASLTTWFPLTTLYYTYLPLQQCHLLTPFQLFFTYRAAFENGQVSAIKLASLWA